LIEKVRSFHRECGKLRTHEIKDDTFLRAYANSGWQ